MRMCAQRLHAQDLAALQQVKNKPAPPEVQSHNTLVPLAAREQACEQACAAAGIHQNATLSWCQVLHGLVKLLLRAWEPCTCKVLPPTPLIYEADQRLPE
jgi:hypothetical protein